MEIPRAPDLGAARFERRQLRAAERAHLRDTFGTPVWSLDRSGLGPGGEAPPPRYVEGGGPPTLALVSEVLHAVGNGKEATAYCCRGGSEAPFALAVAKVYRAARFRAFANADAYRAGDVIPDRRAAKAMRGKTRRGRMMLQRDWVAREWDTLCELHDAGADVPAPYARTPDAILMELIGDGDGAAPLLERCQLDRASARRVYERLVANVELALACDRVHGDLSAFNVLWHRGRVFVIDFPQAADARTNPNASELLRRDLCNLARYFHRYGIRDDVEGRARRLWSRYQRAEL